MIRKLNPIWLGILLLLISTSSCTDLEEELFDRVTFEQHFNEPQDFVLAMAPAYRSLYSYLDFLGIYTVQELTSDEMILPVRERRWEDPIWSNLHQHRFQSSDFLIFGSWQICYQGIFSCNRLIASFEQTTYENKEQFIAELRVLRALYYTWLIDMFGDVPIRLTTDSETELEATPRAEVYAFLIEEINSVANFLEKTPNAQNYGRINYYGAQALLVHLYLNAPVYAGIEEWEKVIQVCNLIIDANVYQLESNYADNFSTTNENSRENMWVIPNDEQFGNFLIHMMTLHPESYNTYELNAIPWNGICTLKAFYESYEKTDTRIQNFIEGMQFNANGLPLLDPQEDNPDPDGPQINFTPEIADILDAYRQDGVRIGKFEIAQGANYFLPNDFPLFRYGEILLNKAEAIWQVAPNSPEALQLINQIRDRARVAPLETLTAEDLLAERGRELAFEGKRRTDLIRFDAFRAPWEFKSVSQPCNALFPIPFFALESNSLLQQNPCY